eukprot:3709238-Rhodomonas_salina.1
MLAQGDMQYCDRKIWCNATCLHICYAMCGIGIANGPTIAAYARTKSCAGGDIPYGTTTSSQPRDRKSWSGSYFDNICGHAISGTDIAYAATRSMH